MPPASGATGSGFISSAQANIPTAAFTPAAGSWLCGVGVWLPETNAVVNGADDLESLGNTYGLDGSAYTDANGRKSQRFVSTNALSISGSMVVRVLLAGAATNNADGGSFIIVQEVSSTSGPETAGNGTGGQAQTISSITTDNAVTGACGTPTGTNRLVISIFAHDVELDIHNPGAGRTFVAEDTTAGRSWYIQKLQQTTATAVNEAMSVGATGRMHNHAFSFKELGATAALTGTGGDGMTEAEVVAGGQTLIITLTGDTWVASGATFDAQRQNIIDGIDSAQAEAAGWDAVRSGLSVSNVVRTSDTVVTITLGALGTYSITANETLTVTVPSSALTAAAAIVASPTVVIANQAGSSSLPLKMSLYGG